MCEFPAESGRHLRAWTGAWTPQLVQAAPSQGCWLCQPTYRAPPALRPKGPKPLTRGDWNILAFSSLLSLEGNIRSLRHGVIPAGFMLMLPMLLGSRGLASWGHTALCASWKSGLDPLTYLGTHTPTRAEFETLHPGFQPSCSPPTPPPAHPPCHTVLFQLSFQKQLQLSAISSFLTRWSFGKTLPSQQPTFLVPQAAHLTPRTLRTSSMETPHLRAPFSSNHHTCSFLE